MKCKDFLHYQRGSKLAVILLLILILLTMILNGLLRYGRRSEMVIVQNEELIREFDSFRQTLKERDLPSQDRNRHEGNAGYATESKTFGEKTIRSEGDRAAGFTPFPATEKLSVGEPSDSMKLTPHSGRKSPVSVAAMHPDCEIQGAAGGLCKARTASGGVWHGK